ncbi:MAG: bifunctional folylpolyglutamate synthase/dihydrofolate synthase [Lachnospiraceae bacterium]|nr:bifunctional folylpolyglutamate synthase/dihydrofolate synthase [Lachnospiraceae bacterium]
MVYSYEEAVEYILNIPRFTKKNPMENTRYFMKCLGNPQEDFKTIHVAGTNGKGSVCSMLSTVLTKSGKVTGLFTSPHLIKVNERIRIDGEEISDEEFNDIFNQVMSVVKNMKDDGYEHPTFFEFIYGMGMLYFSRQGIEYAVIEAGMGGLMDTTNICTSPIACVITSIGLDHTEYLGDTVEKIAWQKAGIIKKNTNVIYCGNNEDVSKVIENVAKTKTDKIYKITADSYKILKKENNHIDFLMNCGYYECGEFRIPFIADYQVENSAMVIRTLECIGICDYRLVREAMINTTWPGRMEEVAHGVIIDGAHNPPGIKEFINTVNQYECSGNKYLLFSAVCDKDIDTMIKTIAENTDFNRIYITQIEGSRYLEAGKIAEIFRKYITAPLEVYKDNYEAFITASNKKTDNDVLFVAGSLYLAGNIIKIVNKMEEVR